MKAHIIRRYTSVTNDSCSSAMIETFFSKNEIIGVTVDELIQIGIVCKPKSNINLSHDFLDFGEKSLIFR